MNIKIGTRGSKLALIQTNLVAKEIEKRIREVNVEVCIIKTSGDIMKEDSLLKIGGKGVFVKEIEDALQSGAIDLAVHSMKDVPTEIPTGLIFTAIMPREDVRDVLISKNGIKIEQLPQGAKIGTGSLRRAAQLLAVRHDLKIVSVRGNIETRLKKIETENLDGVIVAAAGIKRMGLTGKIVQYLPVETMLPAVGQGALGVEIRADDELRALLAVLNHAPTYAAVTAERSFLRHLGGGCCLPIGALGKAEGGKLALEGIVAAPDGSAIVKDKLAGTAGEAELLGKKLAQLILEKGGSRLLEMFCPC